MRHPSPDPEERRRAWIAMLLRRAREDFHAATVAGDRQAQIDAGRRLMELGGRAALNEAIDSLGAEVQA